MGIQVNVSFVSHSGYWSGTSGYAQSKGPYPDPAAPSCQIENTLPDGHTFPVDNTSESLYPDSGNPQAQETSVPSDIQGNTSENGESSPGKEETRAAQEKSPWESRAFAELSQAEKQLVTDLKQRDTRVRNHEMSHLTAAGSLAMSGPSYDYQKGPDGKKYAVGGEVRIDTAPVPGDPEATLKKMQQIKRAALAPADPSSQDRRVAAKATAAAAKARAELMSLQAESGSSSQSANNSSDIANGYMGKSAPWSASSRAFTAVA